jgi:hypothetical protein
MVRFTGTVYLVICSKNKYKPGSCFFDKHAMSFVLSAAISLFSFGTMGLGVTSLIICDDKRKQNSTIGKNTFATRTNSLINDLI